MQAEERKYKNKCCVPGCKNQGSKRHRFPRDPDMCSQWVANINLPRLMQMTPEQIYWTFFVCDIHFAQEYLVPGTRRGLRKDAVPTLHLPVISEQVVDIPDEVEKSRSKDSLEEVEVFDQEVGCASDKPISPQPSTSYLTSTSQSPLPSTSHGGQCHESHHGSPIPPEVCEAIGNILTSGTPPLPSTPSTRGIKKRRGILQQVNVTRQKDLTPRCKKFYNMVGDWGRKTASLQHKITSLKERLQNAENVAKCQNFSNLLNFVNEATYTFIMQQVRTQQLKMHARRFTLNEKILALSLYKSSGKGYKMLSKIFCLPSPRTLTNLLNEIPYGPGINNQIFNSLKQTISSLKKKNDRLCAIVFDELAITPLLSYNKKVDIVEGVEDFGGGKRTHHIADYANVFMAKGVHRQWKQALSFTFSSGPIKSKDLKILLVQVIRECQRIGLEVVATICDQGGANQAVINSLLKDTERECSMAGIENKFMGFNLDGQDIIPLYDVPHLFKGIRNNLLSKDLHFKEEGVKKIARWEHIEKFYLLDQIDNTRMCPKLTDGHIYANKMNKMKVSTMAHVFSHSVGALMKRISQWETNTEYDLPKEAADTGDLILFIDKLFDSLNGNSKTASSSKPLKGGVSTASQHENFWRTAIKLLETFRFYSTKKQNVVKVPSVVNLIKTIKGFINLKNKLLQKVSYILPRAFNQDCLENFFASLRGHGRYNTSPDVAHFVTSFKALLVNNFFTSHSPGANCEKDFSVGALDNLRCFVTGEDVAGVSQLEPDEDVDVPDVPVHTRKTRVGKATLAYLAGYVGKRLLKKYGDCSHCKQNLLYSDGNVPLEVIEAREYQPMSLTRPGSFLYFLVSECANRLFYHIPRYCKHVHIRKILKNVLNVVNFAPLTCHIHKDLGLSTTQILITTILHFWTRQVNLILRGREEKFLLFLKSKPDMRLVDPVKVEAHNKFVKKQKFMKKH